MEFNSGFKGLKVNLSKIPSVLCWLGSQHVIHFYRITGVLTINYGLHCTSGDEEEYYCTLPLWMGKNILSQSSIMCLYIRELVKR